MVSLRVQMCGGILVKRMKIKKAIVQLFGMHGSAQANTYIDVEAGTKAGRAATVDAFKVVHQTYPT